MSLPGTSNAAFNHQGGLNEMLAATSFLSPIDRDERLDKADKGEQDELERELMFGAI